ncbi:MAG: putative bifunctional diguanylate cyclase/phosphodiesterase [Pontibacterium sp.]
MKTTPLNKMLSTSSKEYNFSYLPALKIASLYCLFSALWIILSDKVLEAVVTDGTTLSSIQTAKGLFFIVTTTLLIFFLIHRSFKAHQQNLTYLRTLVETLPDLVWLKDPDGTFIACNSKFERFFGASEADIVGKTDYDFVDEALADLFRENDLAAIAARKPSINEEEVTFADDGHKEILETIKTPMFDPQGQIVGVLGIARDITDRKHQEQQILHQAHFDTLTNLPNRFLSLYQLSQHITEAKRSNEQVAVLFLDLDDFKKVNDSLGHDTGDKLLIQAAARLKSVLREEDIVGRLGGDEFLILANGLKNSSDAMPIAKSLVQCFSDAFRIEGRDLMLGASVGIAMYPTDGQDASTLLRNADAAMYHSKACGRNTYSYFTTQMNRDVSRRLAVEEQMHGALQRDEFHLCFQSQVNVASGNIIGFEALLRWDNPTLGSISPAEFIPVAEHTGLIVQLGEFVLYEALKATEKLQETYNSPFTMAVNLSPRQFRDPNLINSLRNTIQQSGVLAEYLELEITEGVLLNGHSFIDEALSYMSKMGISIAMDDFGSGYSSLSYLRNYPFDVVKIDQSFIRDITSDRADLELVSAAIAMAHSLGMKVLAEGVETEAQLALLLERGCDSAQGYLFSKPIPLAKVIEMLKCDK